MTDTLVEVTRSGRCLKIAFNRPQKRNALVPQMYSEINAAMDLASADPEILVVVLSGNGDGFTAGNDLADFAASPNISPASAWMCAKRASSGMSRRRSSRR